MKKTDVVVIGSGLFGSMTAKHLRANGLEVTIIDSQEPWAASKCSFGVYKEGWIAKLQSYVEQGLGVINQHTYVGTKTFFDLNKEEEFDMPWIDCEGILDEKWVYAKVDKIKNNMVFVENLTSGNKEVYKGKKGVIVCAGVWTSPILTASGYKGFAFDRLWGATIEVKQRIDGSRIHQWAPYKQSVLMKRSKNRFVFGDGATVKNPKVGDKRIQVVSERLVQHLNDTAMANIQQESIVAVNEGARPYIPKDQNFIKQHDKLLWSATGGAKNSTVLCGYIAKTLFEQIND